MKSVNKPKLEVVNNAVDKAPLFDDLPPVDLWELEVEAPGLRRGILPKVLEDLAFAEPDVMDPLFLGMCMLGTAATILQGKYRVHVTNDWFERPVLWIAGAGASGTGKTPAIDRATRPLVMIQTGLFNGHRQELAEWNVSDPATRGSKPVKPPAIYSNDTNIEAVSENLKNHTSGMGLIADELSNFIAQFSGKPAEVGRQAPWLSAYQGMPYVIHRISREEVWVPFLGVCIIGGVTISKLAQIFKMLPADGLMARFCPVVLPVPTGKITKKKVDTNSYNNLIVKLHDHASRTTDIATLHLSTDAFDAFEDMCVEYASRASIHNEADPRLAEFEGKHKGRVVRIAGLLTLLDNAAASEITLQTLQRAHRLVNTLGQHAAVLYGQLGKHGESDELRLVKALGSYILRYEATDMTMRDFTQYVDEWRTAANWMTQYQALSTLIDMGWIAVKPGEEIMAGRGLTKGIHYFVNPAVHVKYKAKADMLKVLAREQKARLDECVAVRREQIEHGKKAKK